MPPMSMSTLYNYQPWNRRRQQSQANTQTNGTGAQPGAGAVVINMGTEDSASPNAAPKEKKQETLFGPNIGAVSSGPSWTNTGEKKVLTDELTPEVLRDWIEKSKEPSYPTTTLQALVNLKRPTLRLSPLTSVHEDAQEDNHHQLHGLEFEYDCDALKCGIYVHVLLPKEHPDAPATSYANGLSKLTVFESIVDGGFNKILKLEEGATLELGRFEHIPKASDSNGNDSAAGSRALSPAPGNEGAPANASSGDIASTPTADSGGTNTPNGSNINTSASASASRNTRRRFSHFHFRKRSHGRVSGPALAVVDEPNTVTGADESNVTKTKEGGKEEDINGIRVIIRLAALDEQGTELASPNEQVTYLHVVRFGAKPAPAPVSEDAAEEEQEDTRPWVVKVVKREATIGPHTFHLHEIYGLSSSSSHHTPVPTAPLPSTPQSQHTYPPTSAPPPPQPVLEDEPSSECLLCLSSPREVVLLPCRHLVACKECALNMVEFGAGGNITHVEEPTTTTTATAPAVAEGAQGEGAADADANAGAGATPPAPVPAPAPSPTAPTTGRRKRRAKGWFCPVCRQPYTSLLRISTNPPPVAAEQDKEGAAFTAALGGLAISDTGAVAPGTPNLNAAAGANATTNANANANGASLLPVGFGSSFLRNLSFRGTGQAQGQGQGQGQVPDVENQIGATART